MQNFQLWLSFSNLNSITTAGGNNTLRIAVITFKFAVVVAIHFQNSLFVNYVSCWRAWKRINCCFTEPFPLVYLSNDAWRFIVNILLV